MAIMLFIHICPLVNIFKAPFLYKDKLSKKIHVKYNYFPKTVFTNNSNVTIKHTVRGNTENPGNQKALLSSFLARDFFFQSNREYFKGRHLVILFTNATCTARSQKADWGVKGIKKGQTHMPKSGVEENVCSQMQFTNLTTNWNLGAFIIYSTGVGIGFLQQKISVGESLRL